MAVNSIEPTMTPRAPVGLRAMGTEVDPGDIEIVEPGEEEPVIDEPVHTANLVKFLEEKDLNKISQDLMRLYEDDDSSRSDWLEMYVEGLKYLGISPMICSPAVNPSRVLPGSFTRSSLSLSSGFSRMLSAKFSPQPVRF